MNPNAVVEAGYDRIAECYLARKDPEDPVTLAALERLAGELPVAARVLDLGCGAGIPVTRWLAERFEVVGVDFAARQLELARENVPKASFLQADMTALAFPPGAFHAVTAFHSIIHIPRVASPRPLLTLCSRSVHALRVWCSCCGAKHESRKEKTMRSGAIWGQIAALGLLAACPALPDVLEQGGRE